MKTSRYSWRGAAAAALVAAGMLVACGGGDDDDAAGSAASSGAPTSDTVADPKPSLQLRVEDSSHLRFDWSGGQAVNEYRLLESADGASDPVQVDSFPPGTEGHLRTVFLPARVNARYVLQACNANGCTDSDAVEVDDVLAKPAVAPVRVLASNAGIGDDFGVSVAFSRNGSTLAVGADHEDSAATGVGGNADDNTRPESGAVYVFTRNVQGAWVQQAYIKAPNTDDDDRFGHRLALSDDGNTLAVGAPREDSGDKGVAGDGDNDDVTDAGAVYVFTRSGEQWALEAYLKASNNDSPSEGFGRQLALSGDGNTLAVGADQEDSNARGVGGDQTNNSATDAGAVYVFARLGGAWSQQAYIKASNTENNDHFGQGLALSGDGDTLAVGAPMEDSAATGSGGDDTSNGAIDSGAVFVFQRQNEQWALQGYVKASRAVVSALFGSQVALSADGTTLAVAAPNEDSSATGVDGDQANAAALNSGAVYVFTLDGDRWLQQAYLKASNTGAEDSFGTALSISASGDLIAVGARFEGSGAVGLGGAQDNNNSPNSGAAYVFARNGARWTQQAYLKALEDPLAPGTGQAQAHAAFGYSLSLAGDGSALAVGAVFEDASNLFDRGAAFVY